MKINILRYILVPVPEVPGEGGGGRPNKSLAGLWPICLHSGMLGIQTSSLSILRLQRYFILVLVIKM